MAKTLGIIAIVLVVALGIFLIASLGGDNSKLTGNSVAGDTSGSSSADKTFTISASYLRFFLDGVESPVLKVKQGDKVKVVFNNEEGFHDFVLDEFNARTKQIAIGNSETIEFVADKTGTFEYYCSVGQHRANGMKGTFIVE